MIACQGTILIPIPIPTPTPSKAAQTLDRVEKAARAKGIPRSWWSGGAAPPGLWRFLGGWGSTDMAARWAYQHPTEESHGQPAAIA